VSEVILVEREAGGSALALRCRQNFDATSSVNVTAR
jgi:hypothetical protein